MTFKETLNKAREVGINAVDLDIATEVSSNIEEEITDEVFEAHAEEIFDEAENRLHAQKAVLVKLMG